MTISGPKIDSKGEQYVEKTQPARRDYVPKSLTIQTASDTPQPDTATLPNVNKTRADFRSEEFSRTLAQHGKFCTWRKALICPCSVSATTGQTDFLCPRCDGSGFFYVDPIEIQALLLMSDKKMNLYERSGAWLSGQTQITTEARYRLGYRDSLETRDQRMIFDELITKGNRRGIRSKLPAGTDSCRYRIVNVVIALCETQPDVFVTLQQGTHFTLESGFLKWTAIGNAAVPEKAVISIRYEFRPTYLVESFPHATRDDVSHRRSPVEKTIALPLEAVGRLDYLVDVNKALPTTWEV